MIIYAVRGLIIVKASVGEYAIPVDNFSAKKTNTGVAIYGGVDIVPVTPLSTIFKQDGSTGFADTAALYEYLGECESIARDDGSGDTGTFVTMTTFLATSLQTVFLVPHGLGVVPYDYSAVNLDSSQTSFTTERVITADSTNIIITFDNAPLSPNTARYRVAAKK